MSFVDLATLQLHHRREMEARISAVDAKCNKVINKIRNLEARGRSFLNQLNCEPTELKERFLSSMNKLDEYIYLINELNLSMDNLLEEHESIDIAPVQDNSHNNYPVMTPTNLMDVLSEPAPTTSTACANFCPAEKGSKRADEPPDGKQSSPPMDISNIRGATYALPTFENPKYLLLEEPQSEKKPPSHRRPKREQLLITFSSSSNSNESVCNNTVEKEVQCVTQDIQDLNIADPKATVDLPQQPILDMETEYEATILSVEGSTLWIVVEQTDAYNLLQEMAAYYSQEKNLVPMNLDELPNFTCCVYHDAEDTQGYFRAMFIRVEGTNKEEVFLVDTGEQRPVTASCIQPLAPEFCISPPFAHCCHLANVELSSTKTNEIEEFLKEFLGHPFIMKIDDNSSESLGVYLFCDSENTLNDLLLQEGLATALDKPPRAEPPCAEPPRAEPPRAQPPRAEPPREEPPRAELPADEGACGGPEHDNPVEAVTGYNNRDEMDICKHYTGGSEKTCFKGSRCKKRHVMKHPDGWTLDRVPTPKCRGPILPAPGTWHKVLVTYVCHFDRLYVMFQQEPRKEERPTFGIVLPPMTLAALIRDMNCPATRAAHRPLQTAPAPGQMVAAQYRDGQWYRARVLSSTPHDQNVEVMYIDYGNVLSVKENEVMELEARFTVLPAQAALCRLAGIYKLSEERHTWVAAKRRLSALAQDQTMEAFIIARGYDELTVELYDQQGNDLAEQLAADGAVGYDTDYEVEDDSKRRYHLVQA